MSKAGPDPRRLSELLPHEDPDGLAPFFRSAKAEPEQDLPRLRWRLRTSLGYRAVRHRRLLRTALTVGVVFLTGGAVGAVLRPYWGPKLSVPAATPASPVKVSPPLARRRAPAASTEFPMSEVPAALTVPPAVEDPAPALASRRVPRRLAVQAALAPAPIPDSVVPPNVPLASPPPSPIAVEQALLGDILKSLRAQPDPKAALAMLDDHAKRFPGSVLAPEAAMLRVEALLGLGRNAEALSLLEHVGFGAAPNQHERLVLRGELRAAAGRWRDARADFEAPLADLAAPKMDTKLWNLKERALWGRASARSHLGDDVGARADLALYLRIFPSGRFAAQATALLQGRP
jgi:hypothetical protein